MPKGVGARPPTPALFIAAPGGSREKISCKTSLCCNAQSTGASPRFTMPHGLRQCELAMTPILTFYDTRDVCRIFNA
jgi:hypothetical protein